MTITNYELRIMNNGILLTVPFFIVLLLASFVSATQMNVVGEVFSATW